MLESSNFPLPPALAPLDGALAHYWAVVYRVLRRWTR
jgi:hypothetical protein